MNNLRLRFPGGKAKAFTTSYDDGVQQDVRLIEIMRKNGVKGTFNLNSGSFAAEGTVYPAGQIYRRMSEKECLAAYAGGDMEVAVHGFTHPWLESVPTATAMLDVIEDRRKLEKTFGVIVRGMAYPFGTWSDDLVDILRLAGIVYCRTVEARHNFDLPRDWLRLGTTCHHNDPALFDLADKFVNNTPDREPWLFYLWGHTYEFEANNNWDRIETFLSRIGGHDDTWYATNIEIYEYVQAYHALIASVDGHLVRNPTSIDVWARIDDKTLKIPAGQTLTI